MLLSWPAVHLTYKYMYTLLYDRDTQEGMLVYADVGILWEGFTINNGGNYYQHSAVTRQLEA